MVVPALCAGAKELSNLAPGCKINDFGPPPGDQHSRTWVRIARLDCHGTWLPFAHHDCKCNQITSLHNRVLGDVPRPTPEGLAALRTSARRLRRFLPHTIPQEWYDMPNSYGGLKKLRYTRAVDQVLDGGIQKKDARIKMFVKFEKLNPTKVNPDPRAIQFRDAKYCVVLARYLKPLEHHLYTLAGDGRNLPASRVIGKGLSQVERAMLLKRKLSNFTDPVVVSLDAKRFDQHVDIELLRIEHMVYVGMCDDPLFAQVLSWQLVNHGTTSKGIKYTSRGKRMSGDMNTALGNCVLMVLMVMTVMRGKFYDMLDDGDDVLVIIERIELQWLLSTVHQSFLEFGMEVKVEDVAYTMPSVSWCQSNPIEYQPGRWKFVRDPRKVLSTALGGTKYFTALGARRKLVNTIGMAELVLNLGVPVLQEFAMALMRNAATDKYIQFDEVDATYYRIYRELRSMNLRQLTRLEPQPITDEARLSFAEAFGISVDEQYALELFLSRWTFALDGDTRLMDDINIAQWTLVNYIGPDLYATREC